MCAPTREPADGLGGHTCHTQRETTVMRALTGYPTRALALTVLVVTAGTVFGWGQSPTNNNSAAAPAHAKVVDLTPASLSGETNQDSEPFLAVQAANPQIMVASAFTPNPISNTGNAPLYVSEDAGNTWVLSAITPVQRMTCDITHAMSIGENHPRGDLHPGTLACAASVTLDESESDAVSSTPIITLPSTPATPNHPFVHPLPFSPPA